MSGRPPLPPMRWLPRCEVEAYLAGDDGSRREAAERLTSAARAGNVKVRFVPRDWDVIEFDGPHPIALYRDPEAGERADWWHRPGMVEDPRNCEVERASLEAWLAQRRGRKPGQGSLATHDAPFVEEGARMVRDGEVCSAREAARKLLDGCASIHSPDADFERIRKAIGRELKAQ